MVANTRKTHGTGRIRPLNGPEPVTVEADEDGRPRRVRLGRIWTPVLAVYDRWRLDDEWWRDRPVRREYWRLALAGGREATIYHDIVLDRWMRQVYG